MYREILFRGKVINTGNPRSSTDRNEGEWVYGDLEVHRKDDRRLIHCYLPNGDYYRQYDIDPDTIGQFTGLKDKNGKEIYEGDIVSYIITTGGIASEKIPASVAHLVHYDNKHATFKIGYHSANYGTMKEVVDAGNLVVIGNIHDNPELIKKEE